MKRFLFLIIGSWMMVVVAFAQSNAKIKELESQRGELQKQIAATETILSTTKKDVGSQLNSLATLTGQIEERKKYIAVISNDVNTIDKEVTSLQRQLSKLQADLKDRKNKYESSVQYMYKNKSIEEKLMFILSAETLGQTYRRLRYVREYATYQRLQGEEILKKQEQIKKKQTELRQVRAAKEKLLKERETEKSKLERQEQDKKNIVASLQKKQRGLQTEIREKRREANRLNAQIDRIIEREIALAKKRAEEERKKAMAESKKSVAASSSSSSSSGTTKKAEPMERYSMDKADRQLSGSFEKNKGLLPVPVSGAYIVVSHYGEYSVPGLKNVKLDNKGMDIQGKPGAQARAIFDGEVSAVFKFNGTIGVLIRHGNYISVYCNLSSVSVSKGDKVKTKQSIGQIFNEDGRAILHFQLRRETAKLNPEPWLDR